MLRTASTYDCNPQPTAAFNDKPSLATVNGFGALDADAGAASLRINTLRCACAPTTVRYWGDAAFGASERGQGG